MNEKFEPVKGVPRPRGPGAVRVLSVGKVLDLLLERNDVLRSAGYRVDMARTTADAMALMGEPHDVVVFGHAVPESERNVVASAARAANPDVKIVMLYQSAIRNADLADAVLSTNGGPDALVRTIGLLVSPGTAAGAY